ncbi:MAG: hypothetical protein Kow00123_19100 [Anaerolineales bacterium]
MGQTVLFVCSNQTHVRMFTRVARVLGQDGRVAPRWVALDRYYSHEAERALQENGWTGYALLPRPEGATGTPWEGTTWTRMRILLQGRGAVRTFLRAECPSVVVLGNDMGILERLFISEARSLDTPSLLVQDGVIALRPVPAPPVSLPLRVARAAMTSLGLRLPDAKPYGQNGADRIAVMGDAVARWLVGQGVPAGRIVVTGQPRYDVLHVMRQGTAQSDVPNALNLPEGEKIILFCSQPYLRYNVCNEAEARRIWRTVVESVRGLGAGYHLVAKLHPAEDLEQTRRWLGGDFPPEWTMTRDVDVLSLLWRADVLITLISSTALEAICLGKPVVLLDMDIMPEPIPYSEAGAALRARSAQELTQRLLEALYDVGTRQRLAGARETFLPAYAGPLDGQAALRVAREIHALVAGGMLATP